MRSEVVLALDIGGTKIQAGRVHVPSGTVLERARVPTPGDADAEVVFAAVKTALDGVRDGREAACGIASCGPMAAGRVSPVNIPAWNDFPLRERVAALTRLPAWLEGDAKALALAEGRFGAARGRSSFLVVTVSTGIGGGVVVDGRLLDGAQGNAGHVGHVAVVAGGRRCRCGGRGCLEAHASGTAIEAMTGRPPAEANEAVRRDAGALVGRAVGAVTTLLDLEVVVLTGSVARGFGPPFLSAARQAMAEVTTLPFARGTTLVTSELGDDGALLGAAAAATRERNVVWQ